MTFWNGRFRTRLDPRALKFSSSLQVDKRLYQEDIEGSLAHVAMLAKQRIISKRDAAKIAKALREIRGEIESGKLSFDSLPSHGQRFVAEDIHMGIENRLIQKIGDPGGKLHTARSRNDQIALDERLFLRNSILVICKHIRGLQTACLHKAEQYKTVMMPGYTHLQRAQPILLAHHLLAYISMLERDHERFQDCFRRVNRSPLGAGALAGTSFPIDRRYTARKLGFDSIIENSIDAVSDRDVQIEFLSCCAITMMHLSRYAEELVLWNSEEWGFAEINDSFTTGSSIMPQKRNPDIAELVRGKTGRVYGDLLALLTVMKGLPLAYNRDMQEDKGPIFDAADTAADCLNIFSLMLSKVRFNRTWYDGEADLLLATELADYLVRKGLPFRKAHSITGKIVQHCLRKKVSFKDIPFETYQRYSKQFKKDIYQIFDVRASIELKNSEGSTSTKEVTKAIKAWKQKLRQSLRK